MDSVRSILLLGLVLATGCVTSDDEELPLAANFLRLQSWIAVDEPARTARGHLRWVYVADDPTVVEEPREFCEAWELLDLVGTTPDPACPSCVAEWTGTASLEEDDLSCSNATWAPRAMTLAFGPLVGSEIDDPELQDAGFLFAGYSKWSPDLGETQGYQALFAAEPEAWTDPEAPLGVAGTPAGEYHLFCTSYWDLR